MKRKSIISAIIALFVAIAALLPCIALAAEGGGEITFPVSSSSSRAELIFTAFEFPENLLPGTDFEATATVQNIGRRAARNIRVSYSAVTDGMYPTNNVHYFPIDNIAAGQTAEVKLPLTVREYTQAGDQQVHIDIGYEDNNYNSFTLSDDFRVATYSNTSVSFDLLEDGMDITVMKDYTIPANVYNTGLAPIYNVHVEFVLPEGERRMAFYQQIAPGEMGAGDIRFFLMVMPNRNQNDDGTYPFTFTVTYEDLLGETHTESRIYAFNVLPEPTPEPRETPEPAKVRTQGQYWMVLLVIVAVSAIVAAISISVSVVRRSRIK